MAVVTTLAHMLLATRQGDFVAHSVIVMRHCARATPWTLTGGAPGFPYYNNYSEELFPTWPVPAYQCLPRGNQIVQAFGKNMVSSIAQPLTVFVDSTDRDNDTAHDFLRGLGIQNQAIHFKPLLFDASHVSGCSIMSQMEQVNATETQLTALSPPPELKRLLEYLQGVVLGKGIAPALPDIKNSVNPNVSGDPGWQRAGNFQGGVHVASRIIEALLMEQGEGGIEVGWGRLPAQELYELLKIHIYYRGIMSRQLATVKRSHSYMLDTITSILDDPKGSPTTLIVGHDTDLDALAALLGLTWGASPFPENSTTPGSALRFDIDSNGMVKLSMAYTTLAETNPPTAGQVNTVPVFFPEPNGFMVPFKVFKGMVQSVIDVNCTGPIVSTS